MNKISTLENFDPRDQRYKKVDDLPAEEKNKFKDVEGGFVEKEARESTKELKIETKKSPSPFVGGGYGEESIIKGNYKNHEVNITRGSYIYPEKIDKYKDSSFAGTIDGNPLEPNDAKRLFTKLSHAIDEPYDDNKTFDDDKLMKKNEEQKKQYEETTKPKVDELMN